MIDKFINNKKDYIIIKPTEGLCNKIRVIAWAYDCAKELNKILIVDWGRVRGRNNRCPGHFYDLFEKIEGIYISNLNCDSENYVDNQIIESKTSCNPKIKNLKADYTGCDAPNESKNKTQEMQYNFAKLLRPVDEIQEKINLNLSKLGSDFISVHIRRQDGDKQVQNEEENRLRNIYLKATRPQFKQKIFDERRILLENRKNHQEHINFINAHPNNNIFVATDNKNSQLFFQKKYKERIKSMKMIEDNDKFRKTSLEDAVVDMWTCAHAKYFLGSPGSSFSVWINNLRECAK